MVSKLPRKQRKARYNATNTQRRHQMAAQIDPDLRDKMRGRKDSIYYPRSLPVRKGDRVRVVRGSVTLRDKPHGKAYKVTGVDTRSRKIYVESKTYNKADKSEVPRPIDPSNVIIVNPDWADPARRKVLIRLNPETKLSQKEIDLAEDEYESEHYEVDEEEFDEEDLDEKGLDDEEDLDEKGLDDEEDLDEKGLDNEEDLDEKDRTDGEGGVTRAVDTATDPRADAKTETGILDVEPEAEPEGEPPVESPGDSTDDVSKEA